MYVNISERSFGSGVRLLFFVLLVITNGETLGRSPKVLYFSSQTDIIIPEIFHESGTCDIRGDHRKLVICASWATLQFSEANSWRSLIFAFVGSSPANLTPPVCPNRLLSFLRVLLTGDLQS